MFTTAWKFDTRYNLLIIYCMIICILTISYTSKCVLEGLRCRIFVTFARQESVHFFHTFKQKVEFLLGSNLLTIDISYKLHLSNQLTSMSIGDGHQPNSKALYTRYKDARVWVGVERPNGRKIPVRGPFTCEVDYVFVDHPTFLERVYGQTGSKLYGLLVVFPCIWEKLPETQMGPLVLIGKDLLVEATAQVVWFVKPSDLVPFFLGFIGWLVVLAWWSYSERGKSKNTKMAEPVDFCWRLRSIWWKKMYPPWNYHIWTENQWSWKMRFPFRIDYSIFRGSVTLDLSNWKRKNLLLDSVQGAVGWFSGKNIIYRRTLLFSF